MVTRASKSSAGGARTASSRKGVRAWLHRANLLTSLVLILPLLIGYQIGELTFQGEVGNGADIITRPLLHLLHDSRLNFLYFNLGLLALFAGLVVYLRSRQEFHLKQFLPVIFESGLYAISMGSLIVYVMSLIGVDPRLSTNEIALAASKAEPGVMQRVVLSLGAGVHEELVFRLAMIPAITWFMETIGGLRRFFAVAIAFIVSSLLFSAAHHVIGGEAWALAPFVYRFFCGILFACLFQWRGLAVAVYTHALYDIWVMLFHP